MKTFHKIALVAALACAAAVAPLADAQTTVPSTTLCAAVTLTNSTSLCLASTTSVVKGTGLYIDFEYMTVLATPAGTTNAYVTVQRGTPSSTGPAALHANAQIVWIALTPAQSVVPGENGFNQGGQLGDYGPCTRTNYGYLPHIWPVRGAIRDCSGGQWVNYNELGQTSTNGSLVLLTASGAVTPSGGNYIVTKAGVAALTLAAPTAGTQDGAIVRIMSSTANAHTLTATGLFQTGTASVNLATFAAQAGAGLTLVAYNGKWLVLYSVGITFS